MGRTRTTRLLGALSSTSGDSTSLHGDLVIPATSRLYLDGVNGVGGDTYITENSANQLYMVVGGSVVMQADTSSGIQFNASGAAAVDVKIQSDTNTNHFVSDAGANGGIGGFGFGVGHSSGSYIIENPPAITIGVGDSFYRHNILGTGGALTTAASGSHTTVATLQVAEPNISIGTAPVVNAASLYIPTAPTEATNNYALFVDAGLSRFDGDGTRVFELPADATDPTGGGGAATGRIPVLIGGSTRYLAYY